MTQGRRANRPLVVFLIVAGGLSAWLVIYTLRHQRPAIPADADHLRSLDPAQCLECHGPAGRNARGRNHPLNDQCFNCHERA